MEQDNQTSGVDFDSLEMKKLLEFEQSGLLWVYLREIDHATNRVVLPVVNYLHLVEKVNLSPLTKSLLAITRLLENDINSACTILKTSLNDLSTVPSLSIDEILLIQNSFELLWGNNVFNQSDSKEWLDLLISFQDHDAEFGYPLGELGWRIVHQSRLLSGYVNWQVSDVWLECDDVVWKGDWSDAESLEKAWQFHFQTSRIERLQQLETWGLVRYDKVHLGTSISTNQNVNYSDTHSKSPDSLLNRLNKSAGDRLYSGALDTKTIITYSIINEMKYLIDIEEDRLKLNKLESSNEIASIISRAVSNAHTVRDDPSDISYLFLLRMKQILVEKLAMRHWHLNGFIETVAYFTEAILTSLKEEWDLATLTQIKDASNIFSIQEESEQAKNQRRMWILHKSLIAAPWGRPYHPVSEKLIKYHVSKLSPFIVDHISENGFNWIDETMKESLKAPKPVLANNYAIEYLYDLLRTKNLDDFIEYTSTRINEAAFPPNDLLKTWGYLLVFLNDDSEEWGKLLKKAVEFVKIYIYNPHFITGLYYRVLYYAPQEELKKIIGLVVTDYAPKITGNNERVDEFSLRELFNQILLAVVNRADIEEIVTASWWFPFREIAVHLLSISPNPTMSHILTMLDRETAQADFMKAEDKQQLLRALNLFVTLATRKEEIIEINGKKYKRGMIGGSPEYIASNLRFELTGSERKTLIEDLNKLNTNEAIARYNAEQVFEVLTIIVDNVDMRSKQEIADWLQAYVQTKHIASFFQESQILETNWLAWELLGKLLPLIDEHQRDELYCLLLSQLPTCPPQNLKNVVQAFTSLVVLTTNENTSSERFIEFMWVANRAMKEASVRSFVEYSLNALKDIDLGNSATRVLNFISIQIMSSNAVQSDEHIFPLAYTIGNLISKNPKHPDLIKLAKWAENHPRMSVRHQFKVGTVLHK